MQDPLDPETVEERQVLVIDDEPGNLAFFLSVLEESFGFVGVGVPSAEEAQQVLLDRNFAFDCCLVDVMLPGMSGEEFLAWLKSKAPRIAVVVVTGFRQDDSVLRCLRHGATDFIEKPVQSEELVRVLESAVLRQAKCCETPGEIQADRFSSDWVELTAPSEMEYLARMQRFTEVLLLARLPRELREDLRLMFEEIGRNAIEWGNKFDRTKQFRISYCAFPDRIVFKFEDEGEGFKPDGLPDPTRDPKEHIRQRKEQGKRPGGFGVYLVQKLMDDVVYSERGNVVIMTKYLPQDVASSPPPGE